MIVRLEVAREFGHAMLDLLLGIPRQAWSLLRRRARLHEFRSLESDTTLPPLDQAPPQRPLRRIFLSCGDASGEAHARRLLAELRARHPGLEVAGFGSERMAAEGMQVWQPLADLNVMGFKDVLKQLPLFFGCVARFARELAQQPPDAVVLVDYPGLNRHLLRVAARAQVPVIDFIAPQLWAWAPWRVRDFRRADRLLVILPFEADWYRRRGAQPLYVGHPLGDGLQSSKVVPDGGANANAEEDVNATAAHTEAELPPDWDPAATWIGLLPGSRRREISENLPHMLAAAEILLRRQPQLRLVLPHLRSDMEPLIRELLDASAVPVLYAPGCFQRVLPQLRAAWVASGTALLEVAAHRVPTVLVYGMSSRLGSWLAAHWLAVPWVGGLNLLAGRALAPEHLGRGIDPQALADDLEARLDGPLREDFLRALEPLLPAFALPGAAARAARAVEESVP